MSDGTNAVRLTLDDPVDLADELMSRYGLTVIRIYGRQGEMLGYLSERDVLAAQEDWLRVIFHGRGEDVPFPTVSDIFTGTTVDLQAGSDDGP